MKYTIFIFCLISMVLPGITLAADTAADDIAAHRSCKYCGMDRKVYAINRMLVTYEDGGQTGVCSLRCAVDELNENKGRKVKSLMVADHDTRQLIQAETANWVMGGNKRGVMTVRPKWAFATKAAAQAFIDAHGGAMSSWAEALSATREEAIPKPRR